VKGAAVFASRDFFVGFFGLGEGEIAREGDDAAEAWGRIARCGGDRFA